MGSSLKLSIYKVIGSLLKAGGFSLIMLMVALSALTGEFPPDWNRVKNLRGNLVALQALQSQGPQTPVAADGPSPEEEISALESFNAKRSAIGAGLLGAKTEINPEGPAAATVVNSVADTQSCEKKIREVEYQLFRLQQRVAELEEKSRDKQ